MVAWVAVAIVSAYALFVAGMNVFLSTSLFETVFNKDAHTLFVSYERGWSTWPGRVHARHLTIRSSDRNVQFVLRIERCDFTFSIRDLALRRTFHVTRVDGAGVTFQARRRIQAPSATPEYVDAIPQIQGFERIPFPPLEPPDVLERWDDRYYHLWSVLLENVVADDVREVWIDGARWEGEARVTGGFFLRPIREARVNDVHVDIRSGHVTALRRLVASPIAGTLHVSVAPFDPRVVRMSDVVHHVTMQADLHGRSPDLANVPSHFVAPVRVAGPVEVRRLAVRVANGKVIGDTHVDLAAPGASIEMAGHRVASDLAVVADVTEDGSGPRVTFHVDAHALTATRIADERGVPLRAPTLDVAGDARALDLSDPLGDLHAVATLPESELADSRLLDAYVPLGARHSFSFDGGRARARVRAEIWLADRRAKAEGTLDLGEIGLRVGKRRLRGATTVDGSFEAWRWDARRLEGVQATVRSAKMSVATDDAPNRTSIEATALELSVDAPDVDVDDPLRAFSATLEMPVVDIMDERPLRRTRPRGTEIRIALTHARLDARGEVVVTDHKGKGTFSMHGARLGLTLGDLALRADLVARGRVHDWAWDRGEVAVEDASAVLTNVDMRRARASDSALVVERIAVRARSDRLRVSDPFAQLELSGSISGGKVTDALALNALLPDGAEVVFDTTPEAGRFASDLRATVERHVVRGSAVVRGQGVGVRGRNIGVRGDVEVTVDVADWRMGEPTMRVKDARVTVVEVAAWLGDRNPGAAAPPPDLVAHRVELRASIDGFDVAHPSLRGVDYRLSLDDARMDDVRPLGVLLSGDPLAFAVESGRVRAAMDIEVKASAKTAAGHATIVLEDAGLRFHETHLTGDFTAMARVNGFDTELDGVDLSGSKIILRNVGATGARASAKSWSGDVTLLGGGVRISERPAFAGLVQVTADDANPILALVLRNSFPTLLVDMLKAPGLSGQARLTIEPGRSAIFGAHLRGDDVVLIGNYVVARGRVRGAATVAKGPVSVGVRVDDAGTHLRLFALDSWMKDETAAAQRLFGVEVRGLAGTDERR